MPALEVGLDRAAERSLGKVEDPEREDVQRSDADDRVDPAAVGGRREAERDARRDAPDRDPEALGRGWPMP